LSDIVGDAGVPVPHLGQPLFYPDRRQNVWETLGLVRRVSTVHGLVDNVRLDSSGNLSRVEVRTVNGRVRLDGDIFILAAGGLGTPALLQLLPAQARAEVGTNAGRNYDDHPSAFVAEFTGNPALGQLLEYRGAATGGNVRLPLVVDSEHCTIAFYFRFASHVLDAQRRARLATAKRRSSQSPWRAPSTSLAQDALAVAAHRAGLRRRPTRYSLFMLAGVPPSERSRVWQDEPGGPVHRRWCIEDEHLAEMRHAVESVLRMLAPSTTDARTYEGWETRLESAAHHSGTARMAASSSTGVCRADNRVFGVNNLYVCDGSVVPWSGYANTGLTIAALSLRLSDQLRTALR
jgi:hypothetical protein